MRHFQSLTDASHDPIFGDPIRILPQIAGFGLHLWAINGFLIRITMKIGGAKQGKLMMKTLKMLSAALALAFGAFAATASATSYVDGYWGSLAFHQNSQAYGWSIGYDNEWDAEDAALDECGRRCDTLVNFYDQCAAIATGYDGGYGWSVGDSDRDARRNAVRQCRKYDDGCEVLVSKCSYD